MPPAATVPDLLAAALARDPGRPLVTYYDEATGERVELSVVTTANWVAKTSNLLQDSLVADASTRVRIDLPAHWSALVWHLAAWSVGCTVGEDDPDLLVTGPTVLDPGFDDHGAGDVVALSLRPMAGRFVERLPAGTTDYDAEVLGHGDVFSPHDPPSSQDHLLDRGRDQALEAGERVLVTSADDHVAALLGVLVVDGSLVLVRDSAGEPVPDERIDAIARSERVSRPRRGPGSR